jgi:hypothetical protein
MFGHEKKILQQGAQTEGAVTHVSKQMQGGLNNDGGRSVWAYDLSIDVRFDDDSTLPLWVKKIRPHDLQISESGWDAINEKIVVSEWDAIDDRIVVGAVVPVRYDPQDHKKMAVDFPAFKDALLAAIAPKVASAEAAHDDAIARGEAQIAGSTAGDPAPVAGAGGGGARRRRRPAHQARRPTRPRRADRRGVPYAEVQAAREPALGLNALRRRRTGSSGRFRRPPSAGLGVSRTNAQRDGLRNPDKSFEIDSIQALRSCSCGPTTRPGSRGK